MTSPLSVVVPCFDDGRFLAEALASVAASTRSQPEIVVVNDGSTDHRTLEVLAHLRSEGVRVLDIAHGGISLARNRGIEVATGRYVLPLDADDLVRDGFIDDAVTLLDENPAAGVVYGPRMEFGDRDGLQVPPEPGLDTLLWGNYLHATCVYRKELWLDVGGYDPQLPIWEDWEFWIHALSRGWQFHRLDQATFDYRVRPGSLVSKTEDRTVVETVVRHVVTKHRELYRRYLPDRLGPIWLWPEMLEERIRELENATE